MKMFFLQQNEETFQGCTVSVRNHPVYGSDESVKGQGTKEFSAEKLRFSIRIHHAAGDIATH